MKKILILLACMTSVGAPAQNFSEVASDQNANVYILWHGTRTEFWAMMATNNPAFSNAVVFVAPTGGGGGGWGPPSGWTGFTNGTVAFPLTLALASGLPSSGVSSPPWALAATTNNLSTNNIIAAFYNWVAHQTDLYALAATTNGVTTNNIAAAFYNWVAHQTDLYALAATTNNLTTNNISTGATGFYSWLSHLTDLYALAATTNNLTTNNISAAFYSWLAALSGGGGNVYSNLTSVFSAKNYFTAATNTFINAINWGDGNGSILGSGGALHFYGTYGGQAFSFDNAFGDQAGNLLAGTYQDTYGTLPPSTNILTKTGDGSGLKNLNPFNISTNGLQPVVTNAVAAKIPFAVIAGVTNYILLFTNIPPP